MSDIIAEAEAVADSYARELASERFRQILESLGDTERARIARLLVLIYVLDMMGATPEDLRRLTDLFSM